VNLLFIILLNILDQLKEIDHNLFVWINSKASVPSLDWFFLALREAVIWIPLYLFMLYWIIRWHKKFAWQFILFTLLVFAITDYSSASIMKPFFLRLRPCADPSLEGVIRALVGCGGRYGMPSTHASNHFGMASFWYFTILWMHGRKWVWLWVWAFLICYAQVYVGKHFPGDIFIGAVLGTLVGLLFALLFRCWLLRVPVAPAKIGE
jgi:undecaprenyl-diphosphatase